jgi:type II secretory pathway pseudopilin PulG
MQNLDITPQDAGFTLIEVIVSFVILTTVLGSVTLSLSYSARLNRQGDAKRSALTCAERFLAEKFDRRPGQPATESGIDGEGCHWRAVKKIAKAAYTESGRNLMALRLEILDPRGAPIDAFDTFYVEDTP